MTAVNVFICMIALLLFALGTLNYEVRNAQEFISRVMGHGPQSREYTVSLDRIESLQTSARLLYQYETYPCQKIVEPWVSMPTTQNRGGNTGTQITLAARVHIGYDLSEGARYDCYQYNDNISMEVHLPEPSVLAIEFDEQSIRSIRAYAVNGNPDITGQEFTEQTSDVLTQARSLAEAAVTQADYQTTQAFFEEEFRHFINEMAGGRDVAVTFSYGEEVGNDS